MCVQFKNRFLAWLEALNFASNTPTIESNLSKEIRSTIIYSIDPSYNMLAYLIWTWGTYGQLTPQQWECGYLEYYEASKIIEEIERCVAEHRAVTYSINGLLKGDIIDSGEYWIENYNWVLSQKK